MINFLPENLLIDIIGIYWYLSKNGISNYAINSLLYLGTLREKYIHMYEAFISQLCMYEKAIRILSKGYLPFSL